MSYGIVFALAAAICLVVQLSAGQLFYLVLEVGSTVAFVTGMAYVPYQQWDAQLHSIDRALDAGTLCPVLDKPFTGRRGEPR